ncbi:glycosyltransferase [Brevirhabdus sp.]|uniref:glycosyltransferase n=1 Tax=Brevirhabdus sp. TaxID=2004514 RepID=UPI004057DD53
MAITTADPDMRLLDLTRLLSRAGRGAMTGVDRVERAYLEALLDDPAPCCFLIRTARGFLLLDREAGRVLAGHFDGAPWGARDLLARLSPKLGKMRQQAEATTRRLAFARARRGLRGGGRGLARMLARHLPARTVYYNVGHSNLRHDTFSSLKTLPGLRICVLLHDTIPLDHPQFQTARSVARFRRKLQAVADHADRIIYNSHQSQSDAERHLGAMGRCPPGVVAHLGISIPLSGSATAADFPPTEPYFVVLGTIEPRKNHALLLSIWEEMAQDLPPQALPRLYILGSRGWMSEAFLQRLEESRLYGRSVIEMPGASDATVAALLARARALLFPSFAEGFGLPAIEAAALGTPVLCAPLPVYREFLGDYPVYLPLDERYLWRQEIEQRSTRTDAAGEADRKAAATVALPTWRDHFETVFART